MTVLTQERTVPVPMSYQEIADDVAERITRGEYAAGVRLPSHRELATIYSVSRRTATRAYERLTAAGVVVGSKGRGMYVADAGE